MYKNPDSQLFMIQQIGPVKEIIKAFLIGNNIAIEFWNYNYLIIMVNIFLIIIYEYYCINNYYIDYNLYN